MVVRERSVSGRAGARVPIPEQARGQTQQARPGGRQTGEESRPAMRFNRRARLDTSQIRDRRGRSSGLGGGGLGGGFGRGGGIGMGRGVGGIGGVILLLVLLFAGGGNLLSGGGGDPSAPAGGELESCENVDTNRDCRFVAIENSLQDHWAARLEQYSPATFTVFTGGVTTGCGQASSQ